MDSRHNARVCDSCGKGFLEKNITPNLGQPAWFCPRCSATLRAGIPHNRNDDRGWDTKPELVGDSTIKY